MQQSIDKAREAVSKWAPQIVTRTIPVDKIGALIGPGGKVIRALQTDYLVRIEVSDEGDGIAVVSLHVEPTPTLTAQVGIQSHIRYPRMLVPRPSCSLISLAIATWSPVTILT